MEEGQNAVHFSGTSFWPMGEGQNAVHFSLLIFHVQVKGLDCINARVAAGKAMLMQSLIHFPHLPWWLKAQVLHCLNVGRVL